MSLKHLVAIIAAVVSVAVSLLMTVTPHSIILTRTLN